MNKKLCVFVLMFFIFSSLWSASLFLPQDNSLFCKESALQLLTLCTGHTKSATQKIFEDYGFSVIVQKNYDRPANQIDHTSAYTIGKGQVLIDGTKKTAYLVVIRGTDGTEWYSNFDFACSEESHFALGFLSSAEDVFLEITNLIKDKNSFIIVAGHSRGAAVANILALFLNQTYHFQNVYAYTYATPFTIRNLDNLKESNIFNFLNPCDIVPKVPLAQWNFRRAGTDIYLTDQSDKINAEYLDSRLNSLFKSNETIQSVFDKKQNLGIGSDNHFFYTYESLFVLGAILSGATAVQSENQIQSLDSSEISLDLPQQFSIINDLLCEHLPAAYRQKIELLQE